MRGGSGRDELRGGGGNDTLNDGGGQDRLNGGKGQDRLVGNGGDDRLLGGQGADIFVFPAGDGKERLVDFQIGEDKLHLDDSLWDTALNRNKC